MVQLLREMEADPDLEGDDGDLIALGAAMLVAGATTMRSALLSAGGHRQGSQVAALARHEK